MVNVLSSGAISAVLFTVGNPSQPLLSVTFMILYLPAIFSTVNFSVVMFSAVFSVPLTV